MKSILLSFSVGLGRAEIAVFHGKGTMIQKRQLNLNQGNVIDFDLSRRARGVYYVKIISAGGTTVSKAILQ